MVLGTFDDREAARVSVKRFLAENPGERYSPDEVLRLVAHTVREDSDPVDPIADSWREGIYGALIGLLEFALEEVARTGQSGLGAVRDALSEAARCVPHRVGHCMQIIRSVMARLREMGAGRAASALRTAEALLCPAAAAA